MFKELSHVLSPKGKTVNQGNYMLLITFVDFTAFTLFKYYNTYRNSDFQNIFNCGVNTSMLHFSATLQGSDIIKDPQGVPNKTNRQRQGVFS